MMMVQVWLIKKLLNEITRYREIIRNKYRKFIKETNIEK